MCVSALAEFVFTMCVPGSTRGKKMMYNAQKHEFRWLWAAIWVLGTDLGACMSSKHS